LNVFELFGKIAIDGKGAMSGIDQTVGHAKKAESNLSKTFKKIGSAVAAAFTVRAVVDFGKQCTQAYANIAAEESAFAQIMGDYADTAQLKLNAVANQTGITSTRMTGAMTSLTAKFKGLGYSTADATTLATDGLLIAADAAAFWDMSLDESMSHLNSFINGSYEGGEAIGLFANDTQMAAYAIEQGIVKDAKAWSKLDEAQKQATRLAYAKQMMQNSGATGQAAKEADAYANVMANLKESWRQFQGVVGKPILEKFVLPAMQKLNAFMPKLSESVQNGITWLETGFGKIKEYFAEVFTEDGIKWDALPDALTKTFEGMGRRAKKLLSNFGQTMREGWNNVSVVAGGLVANIVTAVTGKETDAKQIGAVFSELFGVASETIIGVKDDVLSIFQWFNDNGYVVSGAIGAVGAALAGFAISNPALLAIEALAGLIVAMNVDWSSFESNYPAMVAMFEDLTGLDFTNVATSMQGFKTELEGIVTWFGEHEAAINTMLVVLGGLAVYAGHPVAGASLIAMGAGDLYKDAQRVYNKDAEGTAYEALSDAVKEAIETGTTDELTGADKLEHAVAPILQTLFDLGVAQQVPEDDAADQAVKDMYDENGNLSLEGYDPFSRGLLNFFGLFDGTSEWLPKNKIMEKMTEKEEVVPDGTSGANSLQGILAAFATQVETAAKAGAAAGVAEGVGGITVTGSITTGNVVLDTGALVGQLTPRINWKLGEKMGRA